MGKIRLGHIGVAHDHSKGFMQCVRKFPELFEVVGIVEPNERLREQFRNDSVYKGIPWISEEELLERGVDAVMVEGFELDLVRLAMRYVERGIHVHIDKPAGDDIGAFEQLLRTAKAKRLVVQMGYMYRYNYAVQYCLERIKDGTLGEIYEVNAWMNTEHSTDKRAWLGGFDAGIMFFLGCHMVDLVYLLQGAPNEIVPFNMSTGFDGVSTVDHGFAVFQYDRGISTVRSTSTEVNGYGRRQLIVCGSKGSIEIRPLENPTQMTVSLALHTKGKEYADCKQVVELPQQTGRYDDMMLAFASYVRGEKDIPYSYEYELQLHKMILRACGQPIDFRERTVL